MQCGTIAENQGPTNKYLPLHDGLQLSCGTKGGTISRVVFASFGTPFGTCGGFAVNHSCHAPQSMATVTKLCVGKTSCTIPTDAQSWVRVPRHAAARACVCVRAVTLTAHVLLFTRRGIRVQAQ